MTTTSGTLPDEVHEAVAALLMDGVIPPGERVNIDSLSRQIGVSPTPLREALARLESEGLVVKRPLKGYVAAPLLDREGFGHLFELRLILEPAAAALAAVRMDEATLEALEASADGMKTSNDTVLGDEIRFDEYKAFIQQDAHFHALIAERSGNPLLADSIVRLRPHMPLYRLFFRGRFGEEARHEHRKVLQALRDADAARAEDLMRDHIERARLRIDAYFEE